MILKPRPATEIVVIVILVFYGRQLAKSIKTSLEQAGQARAVMISDEIRTVPGSGNPGAVPPLSGIDVAGNLVHPGLLPKTKGLAIFVVRGASVAADLRFWQGVNELLSQEQEIRLVGYCDGDFCTRAIKRDLQHVGFPIISYVTFNGSQTLLDADENGYFILVTHRSYGWFLWRKQGETPADVVEKVLRP